MSRSQVLPVFLALLVACSGGTTSSGTSPGDAGPSSSGDPSATSLHCIADEISSTCTGRGFAATFKCNDPSEFTRGKTIGCEAKTPSDTNDLCCPAAVAPDESILACEPYSGTTTFCTTAELPTKVECKIDTTKARAVELGCSAVPTSKDKYCCPAGVALPP